MHLNQADGHLVLLHIDDSANDRLLVREAIFFSNTPFKFYQANGMESAIPYFQSHAENGGPTQFPRPALVLLDYDLGNHTGADLLYWLRLMELERLKIIIQALHLSLVSLHRPGPIQLLQEYQPDPREHPMAAAAV